MRLHWSYDANGNKLTELHDQYCDGGPFPCGGWTYDARGNMLTQGWDSGCDGNPDRDCYAATYNANGNMLTEQVGLRLGPNADRTSEVLRHVAAAFTMKHGWHGHRLFD